MQASEEALGLCRFPAVAMEWVVALLKHCGEDRHGVDIFGKDALLLARLLAALVRPNHHMLLEDKETCIPFSTAQ